MASGSVSAASARRTRDDAVRSVPFEWLARAGFVARGVIYAIIGILALKLAIGDGGQTTNQQGALRTIAHQPLGKLLMIFVAVGLGGYALWRLARAALGYGPESSDSGFERIAAVGSGLVYAGLCVLAVELLTGSSGGSGVSSPHKAAAGVLGWPGGVWLVAGAGVVMIAVALFQGYRGLSKDFLDDSKTEQMSAGLRRTIERLGVIGHLARMVVFGLIGVFLIKAAVDYSPKTAVGVDGALAKLAQQSYGHVLLGVVAAGLIAFALYSLSDARYRRV